MVTPISCASASTERPATSRPRPGSGELLSLGTMSRAQVGALYRESRAGRIPDGRGDGLALVLPGTGICRPMAAFIRLTSWQGKIFNRRHGELVNRVTPFGLPAIRARVYTGPSRFDGRESIILDYSQTSWVARWVRDEIREVSAGVYLGFAYALGIRVITFALRFPAKAASED